MPYIKKIETEAGILGIWEIPEPVESLTEIFHFSEKEQSEFNKIKIDKRRIEYLAVRLLLKRLLNFKLEIIYDNKGKPRLRNHSQNISISHSSEVVTVLLSEKKIGIDVENTERNVEKIATRYLSGDELIHIKSTKNPQSAKILYWSAKEAIIKCSIVPGIQFNEQITIQPFEIQEEGKFYGTLNANDKISSFCLWYFFYKNNVVVYCVEVENIEP